MGALRYAVCNELFGDAPLSIAARVIRKTGFSGIEFAPYTIFGDFSAGAVRDGIKEAKAVLDGEGLSFAGFHWLLARPEGLHIAHPDPTIRARAVDHLGRLADASGELGGGAMVFGSPKQRSGRPGVTPGMATAWLAEGLAAAAPRALAAGSALLVESLSPEQTDVVNSMAEAVACAEAAGSPAVSSMFDFHNTASEPEPWDTLLKRHYPAIKHVHANEVDGRAPGTGSSDYLPSFRLLLERAYSGWVSVEIFEIPPDPEATLSGAMSLFDSLERQGGEG